jgi:hypothetical protein
MRLDLTDDPMYAITSTMELRTQRSDSFVRDYVKDKKDEQKRKNALRWI